MVLSQYATASIEEVIEAGEGCGNAYGFQVCLVDDWDANVQSIKRAEGMSPVLQPFRQIAHLSAAGCKALIVTVDCTYLGRRLNEHRNQFALPRHLTFPNLPEGVEVHGMVTTDPRVTYNKGVTWSLLKKIVEMTPLKVFLKGSECGPNDPMSGTVGSPQSPRQKMQPLRARSALRVSSFPRMADVSWTVDSLRSTLCRPSWTRLRDDAKYTSTVASGGALTSSRPLL